MGGAFVRRTSDEPVTGRQLKGGRAESQRGQDPVAVVGQTPQLRPGHAGTVKRMAAHHEGGPQFHRGAAGRHQLKPEILQVAPGPADRRLGGQIPVGIPQSPATAWLAAASVVAAR